MNLVDCIVDVPRELRPNWPAAQARRSSHAVIGNTMTQFEHALTAMERLLCAVGDEHWASWIREDLNRWKASSDTSHHLSAYGAMGSFNDVMICRANQHNVTRAQEPWANILFESLKAVCYCFANHPHELLTTGTLQKEVRYAGSNRNLSGWRCCACGHAEVSSRDIDCFIAEDLVPRMVFDGCESQTLNEVVDRTLALDVRGLDVYRGKLTRAADASGIAVHDREEWMWLCPKCGKRDSAVSRWRFLPKEGRLDLSNDSLFPQPPSILKRLLKSLSHVLCTCTKLVR